MRPLLIHANGVDLRTRAFGARQLDRVDDLLGYPGFEQHELRALDEFTREYALEWELVAASLLGREVAIRIRSNPRIRV